MSPGGGGTIRVRATPTTIACLPSRLASITRTTRTMQPTGCSSSSDGFSVAASRWVATIRKPSTASSSAASERGRPIASGTVTPG